MMHRCLSLAIEFTTLCNLYTSRSLFKLLVLVVLLAEPPECTSCPCLYTVMEPLIQNSFKHFLSNLIKIFNLLHY